MPRVNIEGVGAVNFPDDMSQEQITSAIEKDILPRAKMKSGSQQEAEAMSPYDAFMVKAGRETDQLLKGGKRLYLDAISRLPGADLITAPAKRMLSEMDAEKAQKEEFDTRAMADVGAAHPVASVGGQVFAQLPFGVAGKGYQAAMATGALPGLISEGTTGEKFAGGALGAAGGAVGQAFGNLIAKFAVRRGAAPLVDTERAELVDAAKALGYELTPDQITGKNWQKNLAAALRQNPATSGRMEKIAARQQATTERVVEGALRDAGGAIDQPSAGAAATAGIKAGLDKEAGIIDRAYRELLAGKEIDLEAVRPALMAVLEKQKQLPDANQGGDAVKALTELLGTPGYSKQSRLFRKPVVDETKDDVVAAVRKLGGIDPADEAVGSLAKANPFAPDFNGPVWRQRAGGSRTTAGHSLDYMAQMLEQRGYPIHSPDDLMEAITNHSLGESTFSHSFDHAAARATDDPLVGLTDALREFTAAKNAPPAASPGFIRENPKVSGELAQDLRSDYRIKAEDSFARSKNQSGFAWSEMKGVIDDAIEKALPDGEKKQFASINERYGLGQAVKLLKDRDQQTLLRQIYRGFNSEDEFVHFVAMSPDKEFREVARGFLSDLVEKSHDKTGRISAERLGRAVRGSDEDALRMLGQESGKTLATVGKIGETLLPDLGNSQTANRALFQSLISGGGMVAGGGVGGNQYGTPGAIAGTAAGAVLAPKAVQKLYLSDLAKRFLTKADAGSAGVPALRDMSPAQLGSISQILRAIGIDVGSGATSHR